MATDPWRDPDPQPGDIDAELDHTQIEIHEGNLEAKLSIRSNRATEMWPLLHYARPHGGHAAERVKQGRPNDRSA